MSKLELTAAVFETVVTFAGGVGLLMLFIYY